MRLRDLVSRAGVWLLRPALETMMDRRKLWSPVTVGPRENIRVADSAVLGGAILNASSGCITIEDDVFFGQNVLIAAATHNPELFGQARFREVPATGHDVVIAQGAWIASGSIIIGPCVIGANAVVAAGSVVTSDVAPYTLVAGVPAKFVRAIGDAIP